MALLEFIGQLVGSDLTGMSVGLAGVGWSVYVLWRQRADRPVFPLLAVIPLLLFVVLLPIAGWRIEQTMWERLGGLPPDQLAGVWQRIKELAWGYHPMSTLAEATPGALVLLAGSRVRGAAWRPWRFAWAFLFTLAAVGAALWVAPPRQEGWAFVTPLTLAVLALALRGAWLLAHEGATEADRVTQRTIAAAFALFVTLAVSAVSAGGHIRASHDGSYWRTSEEQMEFVRARDGRHDRTWEIGFAVAILASAPLLAPGLRQGSVLIVTGAAVGGTLAVAQPAWVRAHAMPTWVPVPPPPDAAPALEIIEEELVP